MLLKLLDTKQFVTLALKINVVRHFFLAAKMNKKILGAVVLVVILIIVGVYMYSASGSAGGALGGSLASDPWPGTYIDDHNGRVPKTIIQRIDNETLSIHFERDAAPFSVKVVNGTIRAWGQIGTHDGDKKIIWKFENGAPGNVFYKI